MTVFYLDLEYRLNFEIERFSIFCSLIGNKYTSLLSLKKMHFVKDFMENLKGAWLYKLFFPIIASHIYYIYHVLIKRVTCKSVRHFYVTLGHSVKDYSIKSIVTLTTLHPCEREGKRHIRYRI